ncbi:MAG: hypothetical protein QOE41_462 [Mycobacterium sp.]|jgi:hypothetical protein|nr:hypothetical protein [Mycobacterium sp.]
MTRYRRSSPTDDAIDAQRATSHDEQSRLRQQALEAVNEGLLALHVAEESRQQCPRHDDALNLIGALVDLGDLCVAHHPFDREVDGLAGAAEQLHGVGGDLHRDVGGKALRGRRDEAQPWFATPSAGGRGLNHQPRSLHLHRHVAVLRPDDNVAKSAGREHITE